MFSMLEGERELADSLRVMPGLPATILCDHAVPTQHSALETPSFYLAAKLLLPRRLMHQIAWPISKFVDQKTVLVTKSFLLF